MNSTNNGTARMTYNNAISQLMDAWIGSFQGDRNQCMNWIMSLKLAQYTVVLEQVIPVNNTNIMFAVTAQQPSTSGVNYRTENKLKQQDTLIASEFGVLNGLTTGDADINWEVETFANPSIYTAADAALINNVIYGNSSLKITVNNDVVVPFRDLFANLYIPQTQQTAAPGAGSPLNQKRGAEDTFVTMEPNIYLIGSKNSVPEIILPGAVSALSTTTARLRLVFRGLLAQNSTVVS